MVMKLLFMFGLVDGMNPGASLRHILKIKRFLGTLLHFGCEISSDVGERVRNLVFNLVVSGIHTPRTTPVPLLK